MVVTYIYSNYPADQIRIQIRCRNMVDAINRTGTHHANLLDMVSFTQNTPHAQKVCGESDLLVIYRYLYGPILTVIQYWKARDKKVIIDFDQAVNYLTDNMPAYSFWFEGVPLEGFAIKDNSFIDPPPIEQFKWGLAVVDAATVPSIRLVDDWSRFTKVYKVSDYINTWHYPSLNQTHGNEIWIGLGSLAGYDSFEKSGLLAAMENVCRKRLQVKLILYGLEVESRTLNINPRQLKVCPQCGFEEWVSILLKLNIGLVPRHGDYDLRLGPYDLLEFMISKIPWIASEEPTFHKLSQYGQWVHNTPAAWENAILNTVEQLDAHQKKAGSDPFLFALSHDLSVNIDKILNVYDVIINQWKQGTE